MKGQVDQVCRCKFSQGSFSFLQKECLDFLGRECSRAGLLYLFTYFPHSPGFNVATIHYFAANPILNLEAFSLLFHGVNHHLLLCWEAGFHIGLYMVICLQCRDLGSPGWKIVPLEEADSPISILAWRSPHGQWSLWTSDPIRSPRLSFCGSLNSPKFCEEEGENRLGHFGNRRLIISCFVTLFPPSF